MKKLIAAFAILFANTLTVSYGQQTVDLASLLKEMTDFESVTRFPSPAYTQQQASSYDRKSVSPDKPGWFANADFNQFIREETKDNHSEFVMMDADGPGAIVRFWLTTLAKPGTMRIYFDHASTPSLIIPAFDLMKAGFELGPALLNPHSSYEPNGKGGNTLYLPLPYQQHCKITWEFAHSNNRKTPHYYQVNYRTYPHNTKVTTFTKEQLTQYRSLINETESLLWNPVIKKGKTVQLNSNIAPGKTISLLLPGGTQAVHELKVKPGTTNIADAEKLWRSVLVKLIFDEEEITLCPLGDFIGSGYGGKKIKSWYRELSDSGVVVCRWVMPYRKKASISFINTSDVPVNIEASAVINTYQWKNNSMYFHASYKYEENVKDAKWDYDLTKVALKDTAAPIDWNFATINGKGVYLGNTLAVDNHMKSWYGEGDAKAYVDKETFPSEFGTGLEDYYNTSWAPVVLYQTPFANAPRADHPSSQGHNTFTRTRILDGIPFTSHFSFDMEMLSWDGGTIDAAATTYWYGFPGSKLITR